jgi:hypothetical protein
MKSNQHLGVTVYLGSHVLWILGHVLFTVYSKFDLIATSSDTLACARLILIIVTLFRMLNKSSPMLLSKEKSCYTF